MKKVFKFLCIIVIIAALLFLAKPLLQKAVTLIEKKLYPFPEEYRNSVLDYSRTYNLPPEIVCAVINTESSFEPKARSSAGAMGIMQITEDTFEWLQLKLGEEHPAELLYDYNINMKYGCFFLRLLYNEFQDWDTVFAAYNAGRSRVNGWLDDARYSEDGKLKNIPIDETSKYIKKVNKAAEIYKKHYFAPQTTE